MASITKYNKDHTTSTFVPCDCKSEILYIEYDHEWKIADFCIYYTNSGYANNLSIYQKLRYIWRVLFYGKVYSDQIMLTDKQLKELKKFLIEIGV